MKNLKMSEAFRSAGLAVTSIAILGLGVAGCASTPRDNTQLDQARVVLQRAEADPATAKAGALDLQKAQDYLRQANDAQARHEDDVVVTHLAYLAQQQANIAMTRGQEKTALASIEQARADRDRARLQAREQEVDAAKDLAHSAQLDAASERARSAQLAAELNAKQTDRGMVLTLGDVLFDTNKSDLKPGATRTVDKLAAFLKDNPDRTVRVEGFTDSTGADDYNRELSERRAESVREAIIAEGVENSRITSKGFGEQYAVAGNDNAAGRQQNRRVEIVISNDSGKIADRS
jgi:outer membrane protein OmpA-like peptidoglycan-associated protein